MSTPTRLNTFSSMSLGNTGTIIQNRPTKLCGLIVSNNNAAARYLKLYDKATAPSSADTPKIRIYLPPTSAPVNLPIPNGAEFTAGLSARCTTGVADNDAVGAGASEVLANLFYE